MARADNLKSSLKKQYELHGRKWEAFTGSDMHIVFSDKNNNPKTIGDISSLTVAIVREVVPRYSIGNSNPRAFAKGKRGISGTMTFSIFDRHPLLRDAYAELYYQPLQRLWNEQYFHLNKNVLEEQGNRGSPEMMAAAEEAFEIANYIGEYVKIRYVDQLPPIDVTITFVNDAGAASVARLVGVTFLSEGLGFGQDDTNQEMAATYVAIAFEPLTAVIESQYRLNTV